jgi:Asp-tRNA(Asn)/Glu-tRNA(Gln) amidotransferase A subunit family amidase
MGRSVEDLALLADALQAYDKGDSASLTMSRPRLLATATEDWPLAPLFAFVKTHAWKDCDASTHAAFGELVESLGGQVAEISLDHTIERGCAAAQTVQRVEAAFHFGPLLDRAPHMISKAMTAQIEEGRRTPAIDYVAALNARETFWAGIEDVLMHHGTILTPAAPGPAPKGLGSTGNAVFCRFWTYLGVPAVTLPLLEVNGLPMGVQLVGGRRDDGRLLRTARWLVKHLQAGAA